MRCIRWGNLTEETAAYQVTVTSDIIEALKKMQRQEVQSINYPLLPCRLIIKRKTGPGRGKINRLTLVTENSNDLALTFSSFNTYWVWKHMQTISSNFTQLNACTRTVAEDIKTRDSQATSIFRRPKSTSTILYLSTSFLCILCSTSLYFAFMLFQKTIYEITWFWWLSRLNMFLNLQNGFLYRRYTSNAASFFLNPYGPFFSLSL